MKATLALVLVALVLGAPGIAAWQPSGGGSGRAKAKTMPTAAAAKPTASVSSHDVTLSWTASTYLEGGSVPSYVVRRYDALNNPQTVAAACAGTVTGLSCVEHGVPIGSWFYTVTPAVGNWQTGSSESPKSDPVIVTL